MLKSVALPASTEWKLGDWCICNYRVSQITAMTEGNITAVSDGRHQVTGSNLTRRCQPLTLENLSFAEDFLASAREAEGWSAHEFLNASGLRDYLGALFDSACRKGTAEARKESIARAQRFIADVQAKIDQLRHVSVENVPVLKQRAQPAKPPTDEPAAI